MLRCGVSIQAFQRSDMLPAQEEKASQGHIRCAFECVCMWSDLNAYVCLWYKYVPVYAFIRAHTQMQYGESSPHKGFAFICSTRCETVAAVAHPTGIFALV